MTTTACTLKVPATAYCPECKQQVCPEALFGKIVCPDCLVEVDMTKAEHLDITLNIPEPEPKQAPQPGTATQDGPLYEDYAEAQDLDGLLPHEVYAIKFTERLYAEFGVSKHYPTVFNVINHSYHHKTDDQRHQIVYGWESVERCFTTRFHEYKSLAYLIANRDVAGLRGVHQLCLHEFAHVLQTEVKGGRVYGSCHNQFFVEKYQQLMELYPDPINVN